MWFTDYRPYFEIARLHAHLGNWDCVVDALRVASLYDEVRDGVGHGLKFTLLPKSP